MNESEKHHQNGGRRFSVRKVDDELLEHRARTHVLVLDEVKGWFAVNPSDPPQIMPTPALPMGASVRREGSAICLTFPCWLFSYGRQAGAPDALILELWDKLTRTIRDELRFHEDGEERESPPRTQVTVIDYRVRDDGSLLDPHCVWPMLHGLVRQGLMALPDPKRMIYRSTWQKVAATKQEQVEVWLEHVPTEPSDTQ